MIAGFQPTPYVDRKRLGHGVAQVRRRYDVARLTLAVRTWRRKRETHRDNHLAATCPRLSHNDPASVCPRHVRQTLTNPDKP